MTLSGRAGPRGIRPESSEPQGTPGLVAYIDESARSRERLYLVAAGLVATADAGEVLAELRCVPPGRSRRFHWRTEREESRMRMLDVISRLGLQTLAACYCEDRPRWANRGRTQALKGLLWELQHRRLGVCELVIETRGAHGDDEDRRTIYRARRSGLTSPDLAYRFDSPLNPLLWVPDAIAGAVGSSFADGIDRYLDRLGEARPHVFDVAP